MFSQDARKRVVEFVRYYWNGLGAKLDQHHLLLLSGGLAFSLFTCIVPLILVLFSIVGGLIDTDKLREILDFLIERTIPYPDYAAYIQEQLIERVEQFREVGNTAGLIGIIGLLFAASGLFSSMRTVVNTIFKTRSQRFFLLLKLRDMGMVLLVLALFLASTALFPLVTLLRNLATKLDWLAQFHLTPVWNAALPFLSTVVIFVFFYLLYRVISIAKIGRRVAMIGAVTATLLWELARWGFNWYLDRAANLTAIYGVYVFLVVVATWVYYSAATFVLGAVVGQLYRERSAEKANPS